VSEASDSLVVVTDSDPGSQAGRDALRAILAAPQQTLIALDFDGTVAPIVDDPDSAYVDEAAVAALDRLGPQVLAIAVITGRPVRTAVRLGQFTDHPGLRSMVVIGQYGVERWNADGDTYDIPPDPPEVAEAAAELPTILDELGLIDVRVEDKGRAIGVHTRSLVDPAVAYEALGGPLRALAKRHGLRVEPGKNVWELRAEGIDKGAALRAIVAETGARQVVFAGDDLGDLPAFHAVRELRDEGVPGLLVCSASTEEDALTAIADVVVDGPAGVARWFNALAEEIEG
jgi:trehalose 6-phosphate phosphatase